MVEIWWEDHCSLGSSGWVSHSDSEEFCKGSVSLFRSIGYIVREDDVALCITNTLGSDESSAVHRIIKRDIVRRRVLK